MDKAAKAELKRILKSTHEFDVKAEDIENIYTDSARAAEKLLILQDYLKNIHIIATELLGEY